MKPVEEAFSSATFRQVILPGIVVTAGVHPLLARWVPAIQGLYSDVGPAALLICEIIVFGLVVSSGIQWIYYVYEGFRLQWLTALAGKMNRHRVARAERRWAAIQGTRDFDNLTSAEQSEVTAIFEDLNDFPIRRREGGTEHYAERPTRLGNIIATYELYAESRYQVDGTFFWNHILNLSPGAPRKTFDETYSFAESLVLASFAGAVVAILHAAVLIGFVVRFIWPGTIIVTLAHGPITSAWLFGFGIAVWLLFYWAALPAHRDAGASLRALVDATVLDLLAWVHSITVPIPEANRAEVAALAEYLKNLDQP